MSGPSTGKKLVNGGDCFELSPSRENLCTRNRPRSPTGNASRNAPGGVEASDDARDIGENDPAGEVACCWRKGDRDTGDCEAPPEATW